MDQHSARPRRAPRPHLRSLGAAALVIATIWGVAACGGGSGDDSASDAAPDAPDQVERELSGPGGSDGNGAATGGGDQLTAEAVVEGTSADADTDAARAAVMQTFNADVDLRVEQLDEAVADASAAVDGLGGFAADEDIDLAGSERATVVYRVPATEFRPALDALADIGELRRQSIESDDVTSQYSDLEARVTTLRTSIERLQGFLGETTDVNQIASLESELTRREAELESIESQRRALADQVALSTITVEFDAARGSDRVVEDDRPGFRGGLDAGWEAAVSLAAIAAATVGFLLPMLPIVAVVWLLVWWLRRRRRPPTPPETGEG